MRQGLTAILVFSLIVSCSNDKQKQPGENKGSKIPIAKKNLDSIFQHHFRILDSVAKIPSQDTMYNCCYNSVNFMETNTGIEADAEGDYAGPTGFKSRDLLRWHAWYDTNGK